MDRAENAPPAWRDVACVACVGASGVIEVSSHVRSARGRLQSRAEGRFYVAGSAPGMLAQLCIVFLGSVCVNGVAGQTVPPERPLAPANAEWSRGFTSITSIRELDGGRILVADRGEASLYLVNSATRAVTQVLRRGDGPGEYRQIGWLYAITGKETLLTDIARRRWIVLDDTAVVRTLTATAPLNRRFRARLDGIARTGAILAAVSAESPGNSDADERVLELASDLGASEKLPRLDTIRLLKGGGKNQLACVLGGTRGPPRCHFLEAEEQAVMFPDGWIAVALQHPYRVDWLPPSGEWIRGEMLDRPVPVSEAEKCAAISGWPEHVIRCMQAAVGSYVWPDTVPPFLTDSRSCPACGRLVGGRAPWLFADPHGRLVIRRTPQQSRRENVYDVVDRKGRLAERLTLPHDEAIVGFGKSSVYTIREGQYDLQWLRVHAW